MFHITEDVTTRRNKTKFNDNEIDKTQSRGGTYTLYRNGKPIYDGTSKDVKRRLKEHKREGKIPATEFSATFMPPSKAEKEENKNIKKNKGKYNKRSY